MSTILIERSADLTIAGETVSISDGTAVLDETTTYAVADITIPLTTEMAEAIDPRSNIRGVIAASARDTARTFDLGVRTRTIDHDARTIRLRLASDEELVDDYAPLTEDSTALDHQDSLRAIVNGILTTVGLPSDLEPGDDAPFPLSWDSVNLIPNPGAEAGTTGLLTHDVSVTDDTLWQASGSRSFQLHTPTSTDSYGYYNLLTLGAQTDRTYTASGTCFLNGANGGAVSAQARRIVIAITTSTGSVFTQSHQAPNAAGATRLAVTFRIPANALAAAVFYYHGHTTGWVWWDDLRISEGDGIKNRDIGRLDGAMASTDLYDFEWDDAANGSKSRRTAINPVPPETLIWPPGVSAWEFLLPITAVAAKRLFCDELRRWRLVDSDYSIPGVVVASIHSASGGEDAITRDGTLWADGVVARFTWTDEFGGAQEQIDTAGTPGKVIVREFARPYPGPGVAAAILNRLQGQGRTQSATVITDYTATPGMEASNTLPGTEDQTGRVSSVRFDLKAAFMDIGTRGLTDSAPDSWLGWDADEDWDDVDAALNWEDA